MDIKNKIIKFGLAQINVCVGDFEGNKKKILDYIFEAKKKQIDVLVFPECCVCGYPPEDLLFKKSFRMKNLEILDDIVKQVSGITVILGFVDTVCDDIYNAAAIICDGKIVGKYYKNVLPNYGVFDEKRYFKLGTENIVHEINGIKFALSICEDIWTLDTISEKFKNIDVIVNLSASPYHLGKKHVRKDVVSKYAKATNSTIIYCNMVGGQDELVFDGGSFVLDKNGNILKEAKQFEEELLIFDYANDLLSMLQELTKCEEIYRALVLGTRDYVLKNGFKKVLIGLSGGIDSAIVAAIAVDALGKDRVICVSMPSIYSSEGTKSDAEILAKNLDVEFHTIPIEDLRNEYNDLFSKLFVGMKPDTTEENIQARIRGNILMAMSNKLGALVLTTGNKSEIATGYCTLYGDMAGGFAVIKDVYKTNIFDICRWKNFEAGYDLIPDSIITRPPSAELKDNQKDEDSLPPYPVLDDILMKYIEKDMSLEEIILVAHADRALIEKIIKLVDINEYKRRQAAIGVKITPKSFGRDRRLPITNKFRDI